MLKIHLYVCAVRGQIWPERNSACLYHVLEKNKKKPKKKVISEIFPIKIAYKM